MENSGIFNKITSFFKEVKLETKKVNWPTRKETIKYTVATIAITIVIAIFLGGIDFIFTTVLNKLIMK